MWSFLFFALLAKSRKDCFPLPKCVLSKRLPWLVLVTLFKRLMNAMESSKSDYPQTLKTPGLGKRQGQSLARTWAQQHGSPLLKAVARFQGRANNEPREPDIRLLCSQWQKFLFFRLGMEAEISDFKGSSLAGTMRMSAVTMTWFFEYCGSQLNSGETLRRKDTSVIPKTEILASLGRWELKTEINLI